MKKDVVEKCNHGFNIKSEIRISKSETNSNFQNSKFITYDNVLLLQHSKFTILSQRGKATEDSKSTEILSG